MVVPKRDLVNTQFSFNIYTFSNLMIQNNLNMDMDIDTSKGRSTTSNANSSKVSSIHSNLSSIFYVERMEAQSNNLSWAEQVELNKMEEITLSYATPKIGKNKFANEAIDPTPKAEEEHSNNKATILNNTLNPQGEGVANRNTNTCALQGLKMFPIPYENH